MITLRITQLRQITDQHQRYRRIVDKGLTASNRRTVISLRNQIELMPFSII